LEIIGKGIYSISSAAKLLGMPYSKVYRWVKGYKYSINHNSQFSDSIINADYDNSSIIAISFLDLIELLFINNFIQHGVSLRTIKKATLIASDLLNTSHPFATKQFFTDGKTILAKIIEKEDDPILIDLVKTQYEFNKIITPYLHCRIDFNKFDKAERWWPKGKKYGIVIDPTRNLGQPIINKYNIRTEVIFDLHNTNHSNKDIADWYDIDLSSIEAAISFENGLRI